MTILKYLNLAVVFFLELCMLAGYAYWGFTLSAPLYLKWIVGLGAPMLVIGLWAYFAAPNSATRLEQPWRTVFQFVVFAGAAFALYSAGQPILAGILFGLWAVSTLLALLWRQ
jgi:hypothetical protein